MFLARAHDLDQQIWSLSPKHEEHLSNVGAHSWNQLKLFGVVEEIVLACPELADTQPKPSWWGREYVKMKIMKKPGTALRIRLLQPLQGVTQEVSTRQFFQQRKTLQECNLVPHIIVDISDCFIRPPSFRLVLRRQNIRNSPDPSQWDQCWRLPERQVGWEQGCWQHFRHSPRSSYM